MGINLSKPIDEHSMISPPVIVNSHEAGCIYFVQHKPKTEPKDKESKTTGNQVEKTSHFGLAIDITGSSNRNQFIATHFDLNVRSSTDYTTYIKPMLKSYDWNHYHMVKKIGQIPLNQIQAFITPFIYAQDLQNRLLTHVYTPMFHLNNGPRWSSVLNCQTFTRSAIEYLGCQFPTDVQLISDCIPTMFDIYVHGSLMTGQTIQKSKKWSC